MGPWEGLRGVCVLAAATVSLLGASAIHAQVTRPVAHGLIVKLKEGASAQSLQSDDDRAARRRERMQRVVQDAGLRDATVQRMRPVGRVAHHLDFGKVLQPDEAERLMAQLRARSDVEWVEPNTREKRLAAPNDSFYPLVGAQQGQWWMYPVSGSSSNAIVDRRRGVPGFETTWDRERGAPAAGVAVLDTGIVLHPQLTDRILPGYDFVSDSIYANDGHGRDNDPTDPGDWVSQADRENDPLRFPSSGASECPIERSSWHGTNIAGLLVATTNDATGTAGINWDGKVLPVRVAGKCGALVSDIIDGMRWAAGLTVSSVPVNPNPVRIINISFGGTGICEPYQSTIDELRALGVVLVAAGGNEQSAVTRPAKCPGVIGVGAVNRDGFKANYSNFGPELTVSTVGGDPQRKRDGSCDGRWGCILGDEGVLGLDIAGETTVTGVNQYAYLFGTSFSAPITAGAVSLMLSANPALTHQQILEGLRISARPHVVSTSGTMPLCSSMNYGRCICTASTCGAGLLDADEAVRYAEVLLAGAVFTPKTWPLANIDSPQLTQAAALGADEPDVVEGGGGGALQPAWLLALALLTLLMAFAPRARHAVRHTWR